MAGTIAVEREGARHEQSEASENSSALRSDGDVGRRPGPTPPDLSEAGFTSLSMPGNEASGDGEEPDAAPAAPAAADDGDLLQQWAVFVTGLFGLVGVGVGLHAFLQEQIGRSLVAVDVQISTEGGAPGPSQETIDRVSAGILRQVSQDPLLAGPPLVGIAGAVLVGAWIGTGFDVPDDVAYKVAGVSAGAGTAVLWLVGAFLVVTSGRPAIDGSQIAAGAEATVDISADVGGLLVSSIAAGAVAAAVGAGAVWVARNQQPTGLETGRR